MFKTKKQRERLVIVIHASILGATFLGALLVLAGWKLTLGLLAFIGVSWALTVAVTKWIDRGVQ